MSAKEPLSKERIILEAIHLINTHGLDGLSMRALADTLEVKASSLYWHLKNKNELLLLLSEHICQQCNQTPGMDSPRANLIALLENYRLALKSIEDGVKIMTLTSPILPERTALIDHVLQLVIAMGVRDDQLFIVPTLLNNFVLSFVAHEIQFSRLPLDQPLPPTPIPVNNIDFDQQFQLGMAIILDGIAYQLTLPRPEML